MYHIIIVHHRWDLLLQLYALPPINAENRVHIISQAWTNFVLQNKSCSLSELQHLLTRITKDIPSSSDVLDAHIVFPIFEEERLEKNGHPLWTVETLTRCGVDKDQALDFYMRTFDKVKNLLMPPDTSIYTVSPVTAAQLIYAILYLVDNGAHADEFKEQLQHYKQWYFENGRNFPYFMEVSQLFAKLNIK